MALRSARKPPKMASRIELEAPTAFVPDPRRAMTPARQKRIWEAWEGKCWFCRQAVDQSGPGVVYDHVYTLWIKGSDADADIGPIHAAPCNKIKTRADQAKIAKVKRLIAAQSEPKPPSRLQSRGFDRTKSRGFDGRVKPRKSLTSA